MEQAKHDEHRALWAKYVEAIKRDFEILNDEYPESVQEAYRVLIAFGELVTEPSHSKLTFEEAVFSKIPREKVKWAANILERWTTMDERRAERSGKRSGKDERRTTGV